MNVKFLPGSMVGDFCPESDAAFVHLQVLMASWSSG